MLVPQNLENAPVQVLIQLHHSLTKVNNTSSSWFGFIFDVSQSSILGSLLFNIFLEDLFFILNNVDIASYADDNTLNIVADDINGVIKSLEKSFKALFEWFKNNLLKSNADKCHLLAISSENVGIRLNEYDIRKIECKKVLRVKFDTKLTFRNHIIDICSKASRKVYAIAPYMDLSKIRILINAFFNSQFNYCPLDWISHNSTKNRKINRLHEKLSHIMYNNKKSSFKNLLEKNSCVSIHDRSIQYLAVKLDKLSNWLSPRLTIDIFKFKKKHYYSLRHNSQFSRPLVKM